MSKIVCSVSLVILLCSFSEASSFDFYRLLPKKTVVLDRTLDSLQSSGYYIPHVDKSTFSVSRPIKLKQIDISKIFVYNPKEEVSISNVAVNIKIVQILKTDSTRQRIMHNGTTILSSMEEAQIQLNINLIPDFYYEIQIEMPTNLQFMYKQFLEIREFKIAKWLYRSILVNFFQHNTGKKPPTITDNRLKKSQGIVNRLYLQTSWL